MGYLRNIWRRQYQFIIMSDEGGWTRSYLLKAGLLMAAVFVLSLLIIGLVTGLTLTAPVLSDYQRLWKEKEQLRTYRDNVRRVVMNANRYGLVSANLLRDLELAAALNTDPDSSSVLSSRAGGISIDNIYINFLENVPSLAPVDGFVTRGLVKPAPNVRNQHVGIDIAAPEGEIIAAAASGMVVFSQWTEDLGYMIILTHGDGYFTVYGHNQQNLVKTRQQVDRGDPIALVGNTGISQGPHLHFEIWKNSRSLDPRELIDLYRKQDVSVDRDDYRR